MALLRVVVRLLEILNINQSIKVLNYLDISNQLDISKYFLTISMNITERLNAIIKEEGANRPFLEKQTGINAKRWSNVQSGQAKAYAEEIEAIAKIWPEYAYWLLTGNEIIQIGQLSPLIKRSSKK
jgi:hypothetical protein